MPRSSCEGSTGDQTPEMLAVERQIESEPRRSQYGADGMRHERLGSARLRCSAWRDREAAGGVALVKAHRDVIFPPPGAVHPEAYSDGRVALDHARTFVETVGTDTTRERKWRTPKDHSRTWTKHVGARLPARSVARLPQKRGRGQRGCEPRALRRDFRAPQGLHQRRRRARWSCSE